MARERLYIVVRADLSPAQQAVQGMHALREFVHQHPEEDLRWYTSSNVLAFLQVPDEPTLQDLVERAAKRGLRVAAFHEEDIGNAMTGAAFEPLARNIVRELPCALQSA